MTHTKYKRGFTILELIVVTVVLAVLTLILVGQFSGMPRNTAKAVTMYESSSKIIENWNVLNVATGTSNSVLASPVLDVSATALDVVMFGAPKIASSYRNKWFEVGLIPLTDIAQFDGTNYTILNFPVSLSGGGIQPVSTVFTDVPDEVVLALVTKFGSGVNALSDTGDSTNNVIQYGVVSAQQTRNVTIIKR